MIGGISYRDDQMMRISLSLEDEIDTVVLEMIRNNEIQSLVPEEFALENGEMTLQCTIRDMISLDQVSGSFSAEQTLQLISRMADQLVELEDYLIPETALLWEMDSIFLDDKSLVRRVCVPAKGDEDSTFKKFLRDLFQDELTSEVDDFVKEEVIAFVSAEDYKLQLLPVMIEKLKIRAATERNNATNKKNDQFVLKKDEAAQKEEASEPSKVVLRREKQDDPAPVTHLSLKKKVGAVLLRESNGEKIEIRKDVFKLGVRPGLVDYCVTDNPTVSKVHAEIRKKDGGYVITDLGSTNHTYVNGKTVVPGTPVVLVNNDKILLANEAFRFEMTEL